MTVTYTTMDGRNFTDEEAAAAHEKEILQKVIMLNAFGKPVDIVTESSAVILVDKQSADMFFDICDHQGQPQVRNGGTISSGDCGVFLYDFWEDLYRAFDLNELPLLLVARDYYERNVSDDKPLIFFR